MRRKVIGFIVAILVVGAGSFWLVSRATNPLLGKWIYVSGDNGVDPTDTDAVGERGIEFLSRSRFVMFGYKVDGRVVNPYGKYSFVSKNRVKLQTTGFRTVFDGTNADVKLSKKSLPGLDQSKFLIFSPERQELSEEDAITTPATFIREGIHRR